MSDGIGRVGDLEIAQDHHFQRLNWTLQRYLWVGMVAILGLALVGLFGSGPLSDATAGSQGGPLTVRFQRFTRFQSSGRLEIEVGPDRHGRNEVELVLSKAYLDGVLIERVSPLPERVVARPEGTSYVFLRKDSKRPTQVRFDIKQAQRGLLRGRVGLEDGFFLPFLQLVYP